MKRRPVVALAVLCAAFIAGLEASVASGADLNQNGNVILTTGNTPYVRFNQDGTGGFSPFVWDVAGNETNFFVRDVTNGSHLPLRIRAGAGSNSILVDGDGDVALAPNASNGQSVDAPLQLIRPGATSIMFTDSSPSGGSWRAAVPAGAGSFTIGVEGAPKPVFTLKSLGLDLNGSLSEAVGQADVADVQNVDAAGILSKVAALPIHSWRFASASAGDRHLGPLAGDFATAFGLGDDPNQIAPADVAGVSLAAAQGLIAENQSLSASVQSAQTANRKLGKRVGKLAKQIRQLRKAVFGKRKKRKRG